VPSHTWQSAFAREANRRTAGTLFQCNPGKHRRRTRQGKKERTAALDIARGELRESQSWLESIHRLGYAKDDDLKRARDLAVEVARMLGGLRRYLLNRGDDARPSH
jgi:hypothetical protein